MPSDQAREIVTGALEYVTDLRFPGMLHGAVTRSRIPHGRIVSIDTDAAVAMHGVRAVLTGADVPFNQLGPAGPDGPVLATDRIRQVGDAVALIAAVDEGTARRAAEAVVVTVEPLEVVSDPRAALSPGAPALHEDGNLAARIGFASGDVETALAAADLVVERRVVTGAQEHVAIEPPGGVALWEAGQVTIWCGSQNPGLHRRKVARALAVDLDDVRLVSGPVGGAFGARNDDPMPVFLALLAKAAGAPVHLRMTREEVMDAGAKRHPFHTSVRVGFHADGTLAASDMTALADTGPYVTSGPNVLKTSAEMSVGPYRTPVARFDGQVVYTNNANAGAFRGYGVPQVAFALETAIDEAAARLGQDPVELRRRNLLRGGDRHGLYGHTVTEGLRAAETLAAAAADDWWTSREEWRRGGVRPWRRGTGIALAIKGVGMGSGRGDAARARLIADINGHVRIWAGPNHTGQAIDVAYRQIAADVLGLPPGQITVVVGDSQLVPESGATAASRSMYAGGSAVVAVCERYQAALAEAGSPERLVEQGRAEFEATFHLPDVADPGMIDPERLGAYAPHRVYGCSAQVVRLEVNELTGEIRVAGVVCAVDCGVAINPGAVVGQVEGGVAQGLGLALMEEHRLVDGRPVTRSLSTYLIPTVRDVPEIRTHLVQGDEPTGPMGAKGMAEVVVVPTGPAVAAAVADAVGVRPDRLPITPERLLEGLR
ncbi:xanthine dehydrogenase family protein molybdopterin-binding subunit [Spongiactinospora sp. TRM90649]|uniref:xanthine dehydrogenase family protein molybdopterin-binding subunit n=1 Tax=Spongiactinospora sp. TRM90649 TaxID=3031114 RepID=UPI0023F9247F|nr:xanthine dehydrogenase family protein molybdopterin-binding subunit [Spongiactinospora sp. TRM90649]MDF5758326.1 xanthine dehydrogenase family protein molybdopterin-binding subunit [Spongiactinospora sp. TRM90649]